MRVLKTLVNNNAWIEIPWTMASTGAGEIVDIGGKPYVKHEYHKTLREVGKRDCLIFRIGGTFTYKSDYYIKNIYLCNGSEEVKIDLSEREITEKSGDGLGDSVIGELGGEPAIKVTAINDAANDRWEESATTIPIDEYNLNEYPDLKYELYMDTSAQPGQSFQYGGAVSGVYGFSENLSKLDNMVKAYSQLVVEGSDVTSALEEITTLTAEIEENIPKYTT